MNSGDPFDEATELGPVVSRPQFDRVQEYISSGLSEGARLVAGGLGREINVGYFVRPTVFAGVSPAMTIAREEIFGPVLSILPYDTEAEAIQIANASEYGLASHIQSRDLDHAEAVAGQLRVGYVYLNYSAPEYSAPFGGYKRSGNGREYGEWGLEAYLEHKTIVGCRPLDPV
jgi:aldehyde dehydrogenase (NAD+)